MNALLAVVGWLLACLHWLAKGSEG
jgi:hypothetical protein